MAGTADLQSYVADANNAVKFKLIRDRSDVQNQDKAFSPGMSHQIYGDTENIFGYKDLVINVYYSAGPLDIYYDVKYSKKVEDLPNNNGIKADNVDVITEYFPNGFYTNLDEFLLISEKKAKNFEPAGEKILEFTTQDEKRTFEIHICDSSTPNFQQYHARLESFTFWFIDASSRIEHDEKWKFFVVYERYESKEGETRYASVGYASTYEYFFYPDKIRPRVAQFLILPPFQRKGIGRKLLETIYTHYQGQEKVCDITVEDASEDFQRLRNTIDCRLLKDLPAFTPEKLKAGFSTEMAQQAKEKMKITPKQTRIVYEILRLKVTNTLNHAEYKDYRLEVKKRLNMAYFKEKRDMKRVLDRGFKISIDKKLALPSTEENMEQLDGMYKEAEEIYKEIIERI